MPEYPSKHFDLEYLGVEPRNLNFKSPQVIMMYNSQGK